MRVAIVSYYAPPQPAVASHRVLRLSRALLAAGHEVHWVTLDERLLHERDDTLAALTPAGIVRHGLGGPTLGSLPAARSFGEKLLRSLYHALPRWFAWPDKHVEWMWRLRRKLPALVTANAIDVVLMTCGPHGQLLALPALRRRAPGARLVVDYRDLLSGNAWNRSERPGLRRRLLRRERALLRLADRVFVNTDDALQSFGEHIGALPCPVQVMRNAADFGLADEIAQRWPRHEFADGVHLGFFGSIFPRRRMAPVLAALAALPEPVLSRTTMHVYCDARESRQLLEEDLAGAPAAVRARVVRHDYLPFAGALAAMRSMTALVLVNGADDADRIFVPGKLYDYLMAARPILFLGGRGDAWRIVEAACGDGWCHPHDAAAVCAERIAALQQRPADLAPAREFGSERTFAPLLDWLGTLAAHGG